MDIYTYLYLADKVDLISFNLTIVGIFGSLITIPLALLILIEGKGYIDRILSTFLALFFLGLLFIGSLMPSKDFMYQAGAVYLGKEVIKNEQVQDTFNKVKKVIDLNLNKQIKELNGDKN